MILCGKFEKVGGQSRFIYEKMVTVGTEIKVHVELKLNTEFL